MPIRLAFRPALPLLAALAATLVASVPARAQQIPEIPSTLDIAGLIVGSNATVSLIQQPGATVLAIDQATGEVEGSSPVADLRGRFSITMSKPRAFNGTILTLQLSVNGTALQLLEGNAPVAIPYTGTFPFPTIITKTLTLDVVSSTGPATGNTTATSVCPTWLPKCDIFGTGVVDERDIDFIKEQLGTRNPDMRADVDGNGVVNTLDLLQEMRAVAEIRAGGAAAAASTQGQ